MHSIQVHMLGISISNSACKIWVPAARKTPGQSGPYSTRGVLCTAHLQRCSGHSCYGLAYRSCRQRHSDVFPYVPLVLRHSPLRAKSHVVTSDFAGKEREARRPAYLKWVDIHVHVQRHVALKKVRLAHIPRNCNAGCTGQAWVLAWMDAHEHGGTHTWSAWGMGIGACCNLMLAASSFSFSLACRSAAALFHHRKC